MHKSKLPKEQIDRLLIDTQANYDYRLCGFPSLRPDGTTEICKKSAGMGTDHKGFGYCKFHGGAGARKTAGGLYSKYMAMKPDVLARYQEFINDEDIKSINGEIGLIRSKIAEWIDKSSRVTKEGEDAGIREGIDLAIIRLADTASRLAERKVRMEEGQKFTLSVENVRNVVLQIIGIITDEVKDPTLRKRILERLQTEVKP